MRGVKQRLALLFCWFFWKRTKKKRTFYIHFHPQQVSFAFTPSCHKQLRRSQIQIIPKQTSLIAWIPPSSEKPEWPSLPVTPGTPVQASLPAISIQTAQKGPLMPVSWSAQPKKKKLPEDYAKDRVDKYAQYFKGNEILPIPEEVEVDQPKTLSFIITDLRTRRLEGIKKDTFEESEELAVKLARSKILPASAGVHGKEKN